MPYQEYISYAANIVQIIGLPLVFLALVMQAQSLTKTKISFGNDLAEIETFRDNATGEIHEEVILIKCTNAGYFATAIESARFEVLKYDHNNRWDTIDIIGADMETQLAMPIRIEVGETIHLKFKFNKSRCATIRANRLVFVQRFLREAREHRQDIIHEESGFMFTKKTAQI